MNPPPSDASYASGPAIGETVRRLTDAGKAYAQAELDRAKLKGVYVLNAAAKIAILAVIALLFTLALVVTLLVGIMLVLEPLIGIGLALLATVLIALIILGGLGAGIMAQVKRIRTMPS